MRKLSFRQKLAIGVVLAGMTAPVLASHSWGSYHWKRTTSELTVPVGDNVSGVWETHLDKAIADWNKSTVINSPEIVGSTNPKNCRAVAGTIQVCNGRYGNNGWLGIASIWLSGGHISQGTTRVNDTYFNTATYNNDSWRQLVMCQEIGHDYGLDHQDEDFNTDDTNSCMDYTRAPQGNEGPDAHDYEQLRTIYDHTESGMTVNGSAVASASDPGDTPADWGRAVRFDRQGRPNVFVQELGQGQKKITHVLWALGEGPRNFRR